MTASLTAFGLLPMLFASGAGSEIQRPLAIVVIGGLVSSTFLTLILIAYFVWNVWWNKAGANMSEQHFLVTINVTPLLEEAMIDCLLAI